MGQFSMELSCATYLPAAAELPGDAVFVSKPCWMNDIAAMVDEMTERGAAIVAA